MNGTVIKMKALMILTSISITLLAFALVYGLLSYFLRATFSIYLITTTLLMVLMINVFQWLAGPYLIGAMFRTRQIDASDPQYGWLVRLVNDVAIRNGLSVPKVFISDVPFPNAFAYGNPVAGRRVAITVPLLRILNKDEIKAVLGHEIGHLRHRDVELLMAVGLLPAAIYWLGYTLLWSGMWGGNSRNGSYLPLIGIILIAASFVFQLFLLYLNRLREAYADVNAAITVNNGAESLQTALAKLVTSMNPRIIEQYKSNKIANMLFFVELKPVEDEDAKLVVEAWKNQKVKWYSDIFSDHPHPAKRIQLLERFKYSF